MADILKRAISKDFIGLVDVFSATDATSIPAGAHWLAQLVEGLKRSHLHIVICSKDSVSQPWVNYEAGAAGVRDIPVIPLCHSGLMPEQLPVPLSESEGGIITQEDALQKLYHRIAELLGASVPSVNFESYATEFRDIEKIFKKELIATENPSPMSAKCTITPEVELIKDPNVICVTSAQFVALGYENQLSLVINAFPKDIRHQRVINSCQLKDVLSKEKVDIIHIAAFVCPRGGDLYFSPVELPLGKPMGDDIDLIEARELAVLLQEAKTRLVVLGGSASLVLAAELLSVSNVIAARDMVSAKAMASWVETFYRNLPKEPLAVASQLALERSNAPMKLYAQQRGLPIMRVVRSRRPMASRTG
jgi:hypothetical protein